MTLKDTSFVDLMLNRVRNVLLIANPYDAFMLEDDGRVDEKIFSEYAKLGLRFPPRFLQVHSKEEAAAQMAGGQIDLVIVMPAAEDNSVLSEQPQSLFAFLRTRFGRWAFHLPCVPQQFYLPSDRRCAFAPVRRHRVVCLP